MTVNKYVLQFASRPLSQATFCQIRCLRTTAIARGRDHGQDPVKNFKDFKWPNEVSTFEHYKMPQALLDHEFNRPICRDTMGIRYPGYWFKRKFCYVKEMEPELIVPDLEGFKLKPYVSYRTGHISTEPHTAKEVFDACYAPRIEESFAKGEVHEFEAVPEDIDNARLKALQTGADLFEEYTRDGVRAPMEWQVEIETGAPPTTTTPKRQKQANEVIVRDEPEAATG